MASVIAVLPNQNFFNNSGAPCANGRLHVVGANTNPPAGNLPSWQDKAQTILNANPIILDALGQCSLWLEAGQVYDLILKDDPLGTNTGTPGATIRTYEDVSGASSAIIAPSQWVQTGLAPTFINSRTFSLVGDQTAIYSVGRRVRTTNTGGTKYATIIASVFGTVTTVTLGFQNGTDALDSGLSQVDVGLETMVNPALQVGGGSTVDLTGYTGADVSLGIGQSAVYSVASTSLALRLATGDNQLYELSINPNNPGTLFTTGVGTALSINNAALGTSFLLLQDYVNTNTGGRTSSVGGQGSIVLDLGLTPLYTKATLCTRTAGKSASSEWLVASTQNFSGTFRTYCTDLTTPWTSLGTITWANAVTGRVTVRRLA
jgi:hypothetical protein